MQNRNRSSDKTCPLEAELRNAVEHPQGIVIAALIIGSSIVMTVPGGPTWLGLPFFGLLGFVGAVIGSIWLLLSIWRSGGKE